MQLILNNNQHSGIELLYGAVNIAMTGTAMSPELNIPMIDVTGPMHDKKDALRSIHAVQQPGILTAGWNALSGNALDFSKQ